MGGDEEHAECTHLGVQETLGSVALGLGDPSSHKQALFFSFLTSVGSPARASSLLRHAVALSIWGHDWRHEGVTRGQQGQVDVNWRYTT